MTGDLNGSAHFQTHKAPAPTGPVPLSHPWQGQRARQSQPIYMQPLSAFVRFSDALALSELSVAANEIIGEIGLAQKRLTHTLPAIIPGSDQAALALADKPTHRTNPANLRELVAYSRPPTSPYTARRIHTYIILAIATGTAQAQLRRTNCMPV